MAETKTTTAIVIEREQNNRKIIEKYLLGVRGSGTRWQQGSTQSENRVSNFCVRYCGKWEKRTPGNVEEEEDKYTCVEMNRPVSRRKIAEEWKRINELSRDTTDRFFRGSIAFDCLFRRKKRWLDRQQKDENKSLKNRESHRYRSLRPPGGNLNRLIARWIWWL